MSQAAAAVATAPLVIGRYALFDEVAAGGMATVHLGRLLGPVGFGRTIAVKRLHAHFLTDDDFIAMFLDEARIVARIRHPNVVPMVDVVQSEKGLFLVMEYVHGESLSRLMRTTRKNAEPIPTRIVASIMCGVLLGLHAAHDTKDVDGKLLGVVHRDVSPQNVIVGADGTARVLDFGIAKAAGRAQVTREGEIKGKLAYMAPEQIRGQVDRRTDVFAAGVVLWEMLAGRRLHDSAKDVDIITRVVQGKFQRPSAFVKDLDPALDEIVMRALAIDPKERVPSARDLSRELERNVGLASPSEVSAWVERLAHDALATRGKLVAAMELAAGDLVPLDTHPPPAFPTPVHAAPPPGSGVVPAYVNPRQRAGGEVPSTSAVFAQARPVHGGPQQPLSRAAPPRRNDTVAWVAVGISLLLALIGLALGTYAVVHRMTRPEHARADVTPPPASREAAPPASAVEATPSGSASSGSASSESASSGSGSSAAPSASSASRAIVELLAAGAARPVAPPRAAPAQGAIASPARRAPPKAQCEPPYTVDDVGHRHYKPECLGLD